MGVHVIINGREIDSPAQKYGLVAAAVLGAAVITVAVLFLVLPLVGISIAATLGFAVVVAVAVLAGLFALGLGALLIALVLGPLELLVKRTRH